MVAPDVGSAPEPRKFDAIDQARGAGTGERRAAQPYDSTGEMFGGFGDEISAGISTPIDFLTGMASGRGAVSLGDLYDDNLRIARERQSRFREENPAAAIALNVAGGLALLPAVAASGALTAGSLGARLLQGAKFGGISGAVAGFGEGEGRQGRMEEAAKAGAVGAGLGVALPLLGKAITVGRDGFAYVTGLRGEGAKVQARKMLADALRKDGISPDDIGGIVTGGKPFVLADAGENTRALVGSATRYAGEGRKEITDFLEGRTRKQFARINEDLATGTGARGEDFTSTAADIAERRAAAAGPGYAEAYRQPAPELTDGLKSILARPDGKTAVATAARMVKNKGNPVRDEAGNYTVEMLDQIQRAMRDRVSRMTGARAPEMSANVEGLRQRLLDELPSDLRAVMANYRSESELIGAMNGGFKFFTSNTDDVALSFSRMSPDEQQMFRLGAARALRTKIGAKNNAADASSMFDNENMSERLAVIFPDGATLDAFQAAVKTEQTMQATRNALLKGSQTAGRGADDEAFRGGALGEAAADAIIGAGDVGVVRAVVNAGLNAARAGKDRVLTGISEGVGDDVARMASNPNLSEVADTLRLPSPSARPPATMGGRAVERTGRLLPNATPSAAFAAGSGAGPSRTDRQQPRMEGTRWIMVPPS